MELEEIKDKRKYLTRMENNLKKEQKTVEDVKRMLKVRRMAVWRRKIKIGQLKNMIKSEANNLLEKQHETR